MANRLVLIREIVRRRLAFCIALAACAPFLAGYAITHRYPAYRGRVLELGTDKPIEGAGVLAVYRTWQAGIGETLNPYLDYQAVLTNAEGRFEIPAERFWTFRPLGRFDPNVAITIYKAGYGNFPGSIGKYRVKMAKQGKTDPELPRGFWFPPEKEVAIWLPKLETKEERRKHDLLVTGTGIPDSDLPPEGMTLEQFREFFGRY